MFPFLSLTLTSRYPAESMRGRPRAVGWLMISSEITIMRACILSLVGVTFVSGCISAPSQTPEAVQTVSTSIPLSSSTPTSFVTSVFMPSLTSTSVPTSTLNATSALPPVETITWIRYTHEKSGVSVEYPSIWCSTFLWGDEAWDSPLDQHSVYLGPPPCEDKKGLLNHYYPAVVLSIYREPYPYPPPNLTDEGETGCKTVWFKPIRVPDAEGFEIIGSSFDRSCSFLLAKYYSEEYKVGVWLETTINSHIWDPELSSKIESTMKDYEIFEHMVESARIAP